MDARKRARLSPEQAQKRGDMFLARADLPTFSWAQCARELGINSSSFQEWCRLHFPDHWRCHKPGRRTGPAKVELPPIHIPPMRGIALSEEERASRYARIKSLRQRGLSWSQVGGHMGITGENARKWFYQNEPPAPKDEGEPLHKVGKIRDCMRCDQPFLSEGAHNRMCGGCRAYAHNSSPYEPDAQGKARWVRSARP